jgi:Protein of unknown function, DUF417
LSSIGGCERFGKGRSDASLGSQQDAVCGQEAVLRADPGGTQGRGSLEIVAALLIAIRPLAPRISVIGSAMGVLLFLSTLSFLITASLWTLGDSLGAALPCRSAHGAAERM